LLERIICVPCAYPGESQVENQKWGKKTPEVNLSRGRVSEKILTYGNSFVIRNNVPYYGTISVFRRSVIAHTIGRVRFILDRKGQKAYGTENGPIQAE
jgi:hypothetical protein